MTNTELIEYSKQRSFPFLWISWLGDRDSEQMWAECERPDWLLWWAGHVVPRQELVLAACDCAETALRYVPEGEDRPRLAIETARRWARGEADDQEARAAADAAYTAADAAYTAYAAYAAARAADAADAARAAARAVNAAYAARATMCQLIRNRWPECPLPAERRGE
jgi:hypothetical protein